MELRAATDRGVLLVHDEPEAQTESALGGAAGEPEQVPVTFLDRAGDTYVEVHDGRAVAVGTAAEEGMRRISLDADLRIRCALARPGGGVLVGTSDAHLYAARGGALDVVEGFDLAEGRDRWHTPWGGPPDVRSLDADPEGVLYANVHVGGILRSDDEGETWRPTAIPIEEDVHQVLAHPDRPKTVLAATAYGLARSDDGGASWDTLADGLEDGYCRAVAVADGTELVSASAGPGGAHAWLYRLVGGRFERCDVPGPFGGNLDTHRLAARGRVAAAALPSGDLFVSTDAGATWERIATGLPRVHRLVVEAA